MWLHNRNNTPQYSRDIWKRKCYVGSNNLKNVCITQVIRNFSSTEEMWNFLWDRARHGVKCDYNQHCGRAGESAARLRPVGPTASARAHVALRRRRRDARSCCARARDSKSPLYYTTSFSVCIHDNIYIVPKFRGLCSSDLTMFWTFTSGLRQ